jgi:hypothetical protein
MTAVYSPWNGYVIDKGADNRLGNFSYVALRRGKKKYITFLTVYKITDVTVQKNTLRALNGRRDSMCVATQQTQVLREEGKEPRSLSGLCKEELRHLIRNKFNREDHELVIGVDANENMSGTSTTSLRATMTDLGLFDLLEHANPGLTRKSTMQHGTNTIDYLLITRDLKQFVIQAGEMARHETNTADHPALFLDLNGK